MFITNIVTFFEKYSFVIIVLFCFGFFGANLMPKVAMTANDATAFSEQISGSNSTKQIFWLSMFAFLTWRGFAQRIFTVDRWNMLLMLTAMAGGIALISVLWSDYPLLTFKRSFFQIIFCFSLVSSFYLAKEHDVIERSLFWGGALIVSLILLTILMGVAFVPSGNLAGFTKGKNVLGQNLVVFIALLFLQIKLFGQRLPYTKWLIGVMFFFLLLTISKTSIALLVIFYLIGLSNILIVKLIKNTAFLIAISIFIFIPALSYYLGDYIHAGLYLDPTAITGRGIIWDTLYYDLEYFSQILLGYGYGAYFSNGTIPYFFDDNWSFLKHIASSHNGYLDVLLQYGLIFSLPIVLFLYKLTAGIKHHWLAAAFIIPIVYNITESTFLRDQSMMWCFTVILFAYVVILKEHHFHQITEKN